MRIRRRFVAVLTAVAALWALALPALAQDYTVDPVSGQYVAPPTSGATVLSISNSDDSTTTITLPFDFFYYGASYTQCHVGTNGYIQITNGIRYNTWGIGTFSGTYDGMVAPLVDDLNPHQGGNIQTWTSGTAPNRTFYISWVGVPHFENTGSYTFQVQLLESKDWITFAYTPDGAGWIGLAYNLGIAAPSPDSRFKTPIASNQTSHPGTDYVFKPTISRYTGRILFDKLVSDASGIGNSVIANVPLAGARVELANATSVLATGTTDGAGNFTVEGKALSSASTGTLRVLAETVAASVTTSVGGTPSRFTLGSNLILGTEVDIGTVAIDGASDPGEAFRAPLNIAQAAQQVFAWATARTADTIEPLEILFDPSSPAFTAYTAPSGVGPDPAILRIGRGDPWDDDVIRRAYARHVLGSIADHPVAVSDHTLDGTTDAGNAFAEGFGYYANAAVKGNGEFIDGVDANSANVFDLEDLAPATARAPDVAAWVAMGLFDLLDPADESHDTIDGTGGPDDPFDVVDGMTSVDATSFYSEWGTQGLDAPGISANFIHHGLVPDDASEPNDSRDTATFLGDVPFIETPLVLNLFNVDWYEFNVPQATQGLIVTMTYDRVIYDTHATFKLFNAGGTLIGEGVPEGPLDPVRIVTGPLSPGRYLIEVVHTGGGRLATYSIQAYSALVFNPTDLPPWTIGYEYRHVVGAEGGLPPYRLSVEQPFVTPPGITFDHAAPAVTGFPNTLGMFQFVLTVNDSANPPNMVAQAMTLTINDLLQFD